MTQVMLPGHPVPNPFLGFLPPSGGRLADGKCTWSDLVLKHDEGCVGFKRAEYPVPFTRDTETLFLGSCLGEF